MAYVITVKGISLCKSAFSVFYTWTQLHMLHDSRKFRKFSHRLFGMEIPIQQIWCDLADFTLVRTISFAAGVYRLFGILFRHS